MSCEGTCFQCSPTISLVSPHSFEASGSLRGGQRGGTPPGKTPPRNSGHGFRVFSSRGGSWGLPKVEGTTLVVLKQGSAQGAEFDHSPMAPPTRCPSSKGVRVYGVWGLWGLGFRV